MALITGILRDPANQPMPGVNISLHALETSQIVLNTVVASETTAADGRYTMQVPAGFYSVSLNKTGQRSAQVGKFRVYDDSPSGDLNTFLKAPLTALTPEWFTRIEDERKKAEAQAADARASKLAAQSAVQQASDIAAQSQAHANQAKAEADRAAQVAGLDTVNDAVAAALGGQHVFAQNEVGMAVMRAMNLQRFAASGFVHWGKHLDKNYINQGMW
ncbi:prophage tail fiber N-terminal domain-containing protein, partial [Photobacterium sp. 1_MG-2023]|uniref:prophage tail fiber N-terminal domain-containing protein n=1 Tax=Photobacterium sp. 1_MG-2023 TaxID=3062646 RepID=UPI0026E32FA7